ncbi:MAG: YibE/F family protein [Agathobacter sp.]|nr:YibE/F family protein [Agathobacter sp.]
MKKNWKRIAAGTLCLVGFLLLLVKVNEFEKTPLISTDGQSYEKAIVTKITKDNLAEDGNRYGTQEVRVQVKTGQFAGQEFDAINPNGSLFGADCEVGTRVIVIVSATGDNAVVTVYSLDRTSIIYLFAMFFALVVCLLGGKKGIKSVMSLVFAGICIIYLMFPLMYRGISPILITIIVALLTTIMTLGLLGGFSAKTAAAIVGTTSGVVIAAIAALVFGKAAGITGYNVSDIETLSYVAQNSQIRIGQLLFAGIIISALGATMDVGMSISSTIQELHERNPELGGKELFLSGIRVGRDMMGTMTNTLIFAYVGGALSTLVTNYAYDLSYNQLMNSYTIGIEIMQGLSGSLGVVLTVPVTAAVAAILIGGSAEKKSC